MENSLHKKKQNLIGKIPEILLDNTDRNRTSAFAFTGNKFEFRAVGATANCANPMTVLNAIVAQQLIAFKKEVDTLVDTKDMKKDDAIFNVLREYIKDSKKIRFEGDGYGDSWEKEAKKRKLSNNKTTVEALKARVSKTSVALFDSLQIMNTVEIQARYEIELEEYVKRIQIESRVLGDVARNHIIPTALRYQNVLIDNVQGLKSIYGEEFSAFAKAQTSIIKALSDHIASVSTLITEMIDVRKKSNGLELEKKAADYADKVKPYFELIRKQCDKLELLVEDDLWPLPKYRELLFVN